MGRVITAYLLTSEPLFYSNSGSISPNALKITDAAGTIITLNSNEFPVKVTITGLMQRGPSVSYWDDLHIGNSARGNNYCILQVWLTGGINGNTHITPISVKNDAGEALGYTYYNFIGSNLKGQSLYIFDTNAGPSAYHHDRWTLDIYTHYTIDIPTNITVPSTASSQITLSWTQPVLNDGTVGYYLIRYRDRTNASASWGNWTDLTTTTNTYATVSPHSQENGQRQYAVQAVGTNAAYSSGWGYSNTCTTVSPLNSVQGEIITKEQWDALREWLLAQQGVEVEGDDENLTVESTTASGSGFTCYCYKYGRVAFLSIVGGSTSSALASGATVMTLPASYKPIQTVEALDTYNTNDNDFHRMRVLTSGAISTVEALPSGTGIRVSFCYITAT